MFSLIDVRVDASTGPCIDGLSFEVDAPRALVSGAPYELFLASIGALPLQRGTLRVAGCAPREALARGLATAAAFSAPLPLSMTPLEYVVWSARLGGTPKAAAQAQGERALLSLGLEAAALKAPLRRQSAIVRRATVLAAALLPEGATVLMTDPLVDLEPELVDAFDAAVARALQGRSFIAFAGRTLAGGALATMASEVILLHEGDVVFRGAPGAVAARSRRFAVSATGNVDAFREALQARGIGCVVSEPTVSGPAVTEHAISQHAISQHAGAGMPQFTVDLGTAASSDVFVAAGTAGAIVFAMRPISGVFS